VSYAIPVGVASIVYHYQPNLFLKLAKLEIRLKKYRLFSEKSIFLVIRLPSSTVVTEPTVTKAPSVTKTAVPKAAVSKTVRIAETRIAEAGIAEARMAETGVAEA